MTPQEPIGTFSQKQQQQQRSLDESESKCAIWMEAIAQTLIFVPL